MPVVQVPLDQLLQHERGRCDGGDERDPSAAACIASSEGAERLRDEPERGERAAEREHERGVCR